MKISRKDNTIIIYVGRPSVINLSAYRIDICPSCREPSKYNGEDYSIHRCTNDGCNYTSFKNDLVSKIDGNKLDKDLSVLEEAIKLIKEKKGNYKRDLLQ